MTEGSKPVEERLPKCPKCKSATASEENRVTKEAWQEDLKQWADEAREMNAKLGKMREAGELLYGAMLLMRCSAELQEPPTAYECKKMGDAMQKWAALSE